MLDWLGWATTPAQVVGYVAFALSAGSFLLRRHDAFLAAGLLGALVWAAHFWLLGQGGAAFIEALSAIRLGMAVWALAQPVRVRAAMAGLWLLILAITTHAAQSWLQTASVAVASAIGVYAAFFLQGAGYRKAVLASEAFWLTFALLSGSIAGVAMAVVGASMNILTMPRAESGASQPASRA